MTVSEGGRIQRCACCKTIKGRVHKFSCSYMKSADAKKHQKWESVPLPPNSREK